MFPLLAVALGGAFGASARFLISTYWFPPRPGGIPWSTLGINLVGCFLLGICYVAMVEQQHWPTEHKYLLMAGFLGAFTTFSTFSLETLILFQQQNWLTAAFYCGFSVIGGLLATVLAVNLASRWFS